jgi:predicted phosphoribosyltransferase
MNNKNYFTNRAEAGRLIADKLITNYRYGDTIVLALSAGGVLVGAEIAKQLHSLIALLMVKDIYLPDGQTIIGTINANGGFIYNNAFSAGEIEEFDMEYRGFIEEAKREAIHELHVAVGQGGEISENYFRHRTVIVANDGAMNGTAFDMASDFLKKIAIKKLIMVAPIASVQAVDKMHILADELVCLSVIESVHNLEHYYENNILPSRQETIGMLNDIIIHWNTEKQNI